MQFKPGIKCKFVVEGDKKTWKISEIQLDPKEFDFVGVNAKTLQDRFKAKADTDLENAKRHRLLTQSDYFCLELRLMNMKANVLWGMWNLIYQWKGLGGDERSAAINGEFFTNEVGQEKLHESGAPAAINYERYTRWTLQNYCYKQYAPVLNYLPTGERKD